MKSIFKPLAIFALIRIRFTEAVSATDAAFQKKVSGSGMTTLLISKEEMEDIMKIVQYLRDSGLLIKSVSETIQNETKEQKGGFLPLLLGTLIASLLGCMLSGREVI